jgi:thiol-disulfide isomerase/thioredoxin
LVGRSGSRQFASPAGDAVRGREEQVIGQKKRKQPSPRRGGRWLAEAAIIAIVFFAVQAFVTRDIVRGPLPPLQAVLADGMPISVVQLRTASGRNAFLLYVWATWCPVCKTVEGNVDAVARDAPMLTVAMQSGAGAEVGRFFATRGYGWPMLVDADGRLSRLLGVDAVPALIFVDRTGRVRAATQGYTSEIGIRLRLWWAGRRG